MIFLGESFWQVSAITLKKIENVVNANNEHFLGEPWRRLSDKQLENSKHRQYK